MPDLVGQNVFKNTVRQLESTDLAVPDTWNPVHQDLINNDVHLQQTKASQTELDEHVQATDGAHPALAITYAGSANLSATNVEAALDELDLEKASVAAVQAAQDAADAAQTHLNNHTGATVVGIHGSASAATANTLIHRDGAGRAQVAAPSAAADIARKDTVDAAQDTAIEEGLVVEAVLPVENAEPAQILTSKGPAVQFADGVTQSVAWCRRFPFGSNACRVELVLAADVANAGGFRVRVAWQVNGGAATNVDVTVTPGANTNLYTADLGIIVPDANVAAGQLVTFTLSRLGSDAADTHTGNMLVYHCRLMRG